MSRSRRAIRYAEMTSFIDVMFIVLFASMVQASAPAVQVRTVATGVSRPVPTPAPVDAGAHQDAATDTPSQDVPAVDASTAPSPRDLHAQALEALAERNARRPAIYAHVDATGTITAIDREREGQPETLALAVPLLARVPDRDVVLSYLGDRSREMRVCTIVRSTLGRQDLEGELVIIVPSRPRAELTVALVQGLMHDADRCLVDEHALAVFVDAVANTTDAGE